MESIERTVFISYRRADRYQALAVYQYLTGQQYDVFLDYTSIPSGDFEQIIVSNIKARAHFILVLTPTALDRCREPGDWLRREIETAIDEKRNIVPLFFDGFRFGAPGIAEKLTGTLGALRRYNGLEIPPGYFTEAMERLCEKYLNVPLDAVIHPVPQDVKVLVKEEQDAADRALRDKWAELDKLVRPVREISESLRPVVPSTSIGAGGRDGGIGRNWRLYGIGTIILAALAFGIAGINSLRQHTLTVVPTQAATGELPAAQLTSSSLFPTAASSGSPATAVSTKTSDIDGMILLYVPEGKFPMGSETGEIDEVPIHTVFLDDFWIDQTEVTNTMYAKCVKDQKCHAPPRTFSDKQPNYYGNPQFDRYPVIHVSWNDAEVYCAWADRRLPTEAEWEKAARGGDGRPFPWGPQNPNDQILNYNDGDAEDTREVGSYPEGASPYGALDMAGNVWEWVADWYSDTYYARSPLANPPGPDEGKHRVLRGGGWQQGLSDVRAANRHHLLPTDTTRGIGFRCADSS